MNRTEFYEQELKDDYTALLQESYGDFAKRTGRQLADERVKNVGETWGDYWARKANQKDYIDTMAAASDNAAEAERAEQATRAKMSKEIVAKLMAYDKDITGRRTQQRHGLYVDFDAYQQAEFNTQRVVLCKEEDLVRSHIVQWSETMREHLHTAECCDSKICTHAQRDREFSEMCREREAEAEIQRQLELQKEEAKRQRHEAEMLARREKEQREAEKKEERRRREEEKRAKRRTEVGRTQSNFSEDNAV